MSKWSQVMLLISLVVGCLAIWLSAAPVGLTGDLVTGSWIALYMNEEGFFWPPAVGCTGYYCEPRMNATGVTFSCTTGGPYSCLGGTFLGAQYKGNGYTVHATGPNVCAHVYDDSPAFWFCEVDLREAQFY
jgi:hypothetical protein